MSDVTKDTPTVATTAATAEASSSSAAAAGDGVHTTKPTMHDTHASTSDNGSSSNNKSTPEACTHAAAHDETALSTVAPALLQSAHDIVTHTFATYPLHAIGVAFNGGKDCVVMTELIRETVGVDRLRRCCIFVLEEADEFSELARFRDEYVATRLPGATLHHIDAQGDLCKGLWQVKRQFAIDAVFVGTRRSDPDGKYQKTPCEPTTAGWPPMLRVCPVLDWGYRDVWSYILTHKVPYCKLYSRGYTSLGSRECTTPHDDLRNDDGSYCPAWHLESGAHERDGRV